MSAATKKYIKLEVLRELYVQNMAHKLGCLSCKPKDNCDTGKFLNQYIETYKEQV